jgi:hypothetical protein
MTEAIQRTQPNGMELLADMARNIRDPQAAIEIARQIVALQVQQEQLRQAQERFDWEKQDRKARVAFAEAFEKFKADAPKILKSKHVQFETKSGGRTDYWHVELDKACDLLVPALLKVGITHRWKSTDLPGGMVRVTCYLRHRLGYEEEGASLSGPADQTGGKNPIQGIGSSTTYLERYTFLATCGIVPTGADDDGNPQGMTQGEADEYIARMNAAEDSKQLWAVYQEAINAAKKMDPIDYRAMTIMTEARDQRALELKRGAK